MSGQNPSTFVAMILIIVFANVAGLYGLIISLTLPNQGKPACHVECYNPCCENSKLRTAACAPACIPPLPVSPTYRVFSHLCSGGRRLVVVLQGDLATVKPAAKGRNPFRQTQGRIIDVTVLRAWGRSFSLA